MEFDILSKTFIESIVPVIFDWMWVIVFVSIVQGIYYITRSDRKSGIDRIKHATMGYIMLKCIIVFLDLVDMVTNSIVIK